MPEMIQRLIAMLMSRIRVNQTSHGLRNGLPVFVKRRRFGGGLVIWFGNRFLDFARSGVSMIVRADEWCAWEACCSSLLYPDRPEVTIGPGNIVNIPEVRGTSLRRLAFRNELDLRSVVTAARELRRVHQIECSYFRAAWSHGDMHLDNIIYDAGTDRVVLIDFDTRHQPGIDEVQRHGDDLKMMLLELISLPNDTWPQLATALVHEYHEPTVLKEVNRQLVVPQGFARILWLTRTQCSSIRRSEERMVRLRNIIQQITGDSNDRV